MNNKMKRIEYEKKTIKSMIEIYCLENHKKAKLCPDCSDLLNYALKRVDLCPLRDDKPTCKNCLIHCYSKDYREKIKTVMRYSGPKMIFKHPLLSVVYLINKFKDKYRKKRFFDMKNKITIDR